MHQVRREVLLILLLYCFWFWCTRSDTMEGYLRCMRVADLAIEAQVICHTHV